MMESEDREKPVLTVVRGLPGSGKSTWARRLGCLVLENDMFHVRGGEYRWSASRMKDAVSWCMDFVRCALERGMDVAVANTFCRRRFVEAYRRIAEEAGAGFRVVRCSGSFGSVHAVPEATVESMKASFEDWPGEEIL